MAVVINEFEVMPSPPQQGQGAQSDKGGDGQKSVPTDHEIERMVEHQMSRCERVWAH